MEGVTNTLTPNKIRSVLTKNDLRPHSDRNRDGIRVRALSDSTVRVTADYVSARDTATAIDAIKDVLTTAGYMLTDSGDDAVHVTR